MQPNKARADLWMDLALVGFLVALDILARLLPHAPGVWPVAATALFAGRTLRMPALALLVPLGATALSNLALPTDDWRIALTVFAATAVAVLAGMLTRRRGAAAVVAAMVSSSLIFFAATNFAVWAFSGMYPPSFEGLVQCYVAALPFLDRTVLGDLFWLGVLFGGAWLVQHNPLAARRPL